jgi:succinoglycan biosynthesis transport protein ExoP
MDKHDALTPRQSGFSSIDVPRRFPDSEAQGWDSFSYLRAYSQILKKRWATIASAVLIVAVLAAIISFKMKPVYQSTALLDVEADTTQIQSLNDLYRQSPTDADFIGTQIQVLKGEDLAWQTIQELALAQNPEFVPRRQGAADSQVSDDAVIGAFLGHLQVQQVRDSHVVKVSFESTNAELAALVANKLAEDYVEYNFRQKYDATRQVSHWMENQLDELKAKVEKSQQALVDYERQNAIVNIGDKQSVAEQRLTDMSRDLTQAQSDRVQKESLYELAKTNESQVALLAQNQLLERLDEKYADLKAQYADAVGQYGRKFPKAKRLESQMQEIQTFMGAERTRTVERIRNDYAAALNRERLLTAAVAKEKAEVGRVNELLIEHNMLKRDFETNQQLYDSLLQRLKDATVSAGLRATNIHLIGRAKPQATPIRPRKVRNILVGMMIGLILGVVISFAQEAMDSCVRTVEEAEHLMEVPALAVVPLERFKPFRPLRGNGHTGDGHENRAALALLNQPKSRLAESFRTLITTILLSTYRETPRALLVTSLRAGEGKTTTALNLAIGLAQRGDNVLILDADLRNPGISKMLTAPYGKGLAGLLTGEVGVDQAIKKVLAVPRLWVLPSGTDAASPAQLLAADSMQSTLAELRHRFKYIIVDCPPLLPVADALALSTLVDGVLLVIESGTTPREAAARARTILGNVGANILGLVLNKADFRHDAYYYGRYYASYYTYPEEKVKA